ncbi:MAG: DUF3179 domain-containing protein [Bacteroidales bacterium]|nr:DUF3179 domain-containing protein [Bacteroidales bacterium]
MKKLLLSILLLSILLLNCQKAEMNKPTTSSINDLNNGWQVPLDQLVISSLPMDRIPSIDDPYFEELNDHHLNPFEKVYVYRFENTLKVYPQNILAIHEIVNDHIGDHYFAITYCPLTASAIAWNREISGSITEFGVSGHLYHDNLIAYDRNSQNYWSQMSLKSIKGSHTGELLESEALLLSNAETIIQSFPKALVLVDTLTHSCDSVCNGKNKASLSGDFFGIIKQEIAHEDEALLFNYDHFSDTIGIYQFTFDNKEVLIVGSRKLQFIHAYIIQSPNLYYPVQDALPIIFKDNVGNMYDLSGYIIDGPQKGNRLTSPISYTAHSFAWELFFPNHTEIFEE